MRNSSPNHMDIIAVILILNMIGFIFASYNKYHRNYKTFYECNISNQSVVYNGKEFRIFKSKYEASNHMSPPCTKISE